MAFKQSRTFSPHKTQTQQTTSWLAPHPLTAQTQHDGDSPATNLAEVQTLDQAARFGHHFVNIPVHPPDTQAYAPVQPKSMTGDQPLLLSEQRPNQTGLPDHLKAGIEKLSGFSLDNVKVHFNSDEPARLEALAYTQGTDIHVGPGQERHLAHEAWHVVQQAKGRVKPTIHMKDRVPINDDKGLEHEADVMSEKALQMRKGAFEFPIHTISPHRLSGQGALAGGNSTLSRGAVLPRASSLAGSGAVLQRLVAQSRWLKKDDGEDKFRWSEKPNGPWSEPIKDTSSEGYRSRAEQELGFVAPFMILAKHGVIARGSPDGNKPPLARAHLIAAEFGGQIQYPNASDNIRFHPQDLEYGDWQQKELAVSREGKRGFLTARSTELGDTAPQRLAAGVITKLEVANSADAALTIQAALVQIFKAAAYAPASVSFEWTDRGGGPDVVQEWTGLGSRLDVLPSATKNGTRLALVELGIELPKNVEVEQDRFTINSREALIAAIKAVKPLKTAQDVFTRLIEKINRWITEPPFKEKTGDDFAGELKKHKWFSNDPRQIVVIGDFHKFDALKENDFK